MARFPAQGFVVRSVYLSAIDSENQSFALADTAQIIDFDTLLENEKINSLGNGEFQVIDTGSYLILCTVQIVKTANGEMTYCLWLQKDIGSGFVDIPNSSTQSVATGVGTSANVSRTVTFQMEVKLDRNNKIRFQNIVDNTNLELMAFSPLVGTDIPSAKISITKTGSL